MSDEGKIVYGLGANTDELGKDLRRAKGMFSDLSDSTQKEGAKMDNMMGKLAMSIGVAFSATAAAAYIKQIASIRGEFQQLEVAFNTMLGSKRASDQLMAQIVETAAKTRYDLQTVAGGAKSLLAYGTAAEKVNDELVMLGNVAAGLSIPLNDLIYLYGTTQVQGRLYTQDMRQFISRGIPVAEELAKQFGVTKDKVSELVEAGKVGFPEIEKAFESMTGKGGKFYNLMAEQSKTITGQISNLGDAVQSMMNEVGKSNEGIISSVIAGASTVVKNYESIGRAIAALIATYGTYKAALITIAALKKVVAASSTATVYLEMNRALGALTLRHKAAAVAIGMQTAAQKALNAATAMNPYVLAATALVGLGMTIWALRDRTTAAERATRQYNEQLEELASLEQKRKDTVEQAIDTLNNQHSSDKQRIAAMQTLIDLYPKIMEKYNLEKLTLEQILQLKKEIANEDSSRETQSIQSRIDAQKKLIADLERNRERDPNYFFQKRMEKRIDTEKEVLNKLIKEQEQDNARIFFNSVSGFSEDELKREIDRRERLLSRIGNTDNLGRINGLGTFTKVEINTQLNMLKNEQKERTAIRTTAAKDIANSNKEIKRLEDERRKILTQEMTPEERQKRIEDIDKLLDAEKKKIAAYTRSMTDPKGNQAELQAQVLRNRMMLRRAEEDMEAQIEQSEIDNKQKGATREMAQLKLNHKKKITELNRQEEDLLIQIKENAELEHKARGFKGKLNTSEIQLTDEQKQTFDKLRGLEADAYVLKQQEINQRLLDEYRNYAQQKLAIEKKFQEDIQRLAELEGADSNAVKEAQDQMKKALEALKKTALDNTGKGLVELYLFGDGSDFIQSKVKEALPLFEDISKLTIKELQKVKEAISEIKLTPEQIATLEAAGVEVEKLVEALERVKDKSTEAVTAKEWEKIIGIANQLAGSLSKLGSALQQLEGTSREIGLVISGLAGGIDNLARVFDKNATSTDKIAAGISGLADLYAMIANQIEANKRKQQEWNDKIVQSAHLAAMARIETEKYKESNIFGVEDPYAKAIAGAMQYAAAMEELNATAALIESGKVQTGTEQKISWGNVAAGAGAGAGAGAAIGSFFGPLGTFIGAGIGALIGATAGAFATKTVEVFSSLKDKYGEIFNSETFELNPEILQDYDKMDDATKKLIDNWEAIRDKALEAKEQMRQTFKDLAGEIGSSLSDALVEAFTNGNVFSAIDKFKESVTKVIEQLIQQMLFAKYFQHLFDKLEEEMIDSFSEGGDQSIIDDILRFTEQYPAALEEYNQGMLEAQETLKKKGIDIFNLSNRTAVNKGIATANQDSVNELNGRMTAVQGHTFNISESMKGLVNLMGQVISHLFNIERHTSRLEKIENTMNSVKSGIDQINTKGINIRV